MTFCRVAKIPETEQTLSNCGLQCLLGLCSLHHLVKKIASRSCSASDSSSLRGFLVNVAIASATIQASKVCSLSKLSFGS